MKILITGGTGFIGTQLGDFLSDQGHSVIAIGSRKVTDFSTHSAIEYLQADTTNPGSWQEDVSKSDLVINLAGRTIFHRWTQKYKKQMVNSRVVTTRHVVDAMESKNQVLINASAVGYYGDSGETVLNEDSPGGDDFLAQLSKNWESEALRFRSRAGRVVITRFGIVLGLDGGALPLMAKAFRSFMGGPLGSGRQWVPWIHIEDLLAAIAFVMDHPDIEGPVNFCSPHPVRNKEMATLLGNVLGRPARIPAPVTALKLMMGELADVLLASQKAMPARLLDGGFAFAHPDLEEALVDLLGGGSGI